jgi:hypothetical protein
LRVHAAFVIVEFMKRPSVGTAASLSSAARDAAAADGRLIASDVAKFAVEGR